MCGIDTQKRNKTAKITMHKRERRTLGERRTESRGGGGDEGSGREESWKEEKHGEGRERPRYVNPALHARRQQISRWTGHACTYHRSWASWETWDLAGSKVPCFCAREMKIKETGLVVGKWKRMGRGKERDGHVLTHTQGSTVRTVIVVGGEVVVAVVAVRN